MSVQNEYCPYAFFENKVVPTEQAQVFIGAKVVQYGLGIFAGIRGYYNKEKGFLSLFRIEDHYKRFLDSNKIMGVAFSYSLEDLKKISLELVEKNKPQTNVYVRPFSYASSTKLAPNLDHDPEFAFALYMLPMGEYLSLDKGLSVCISSWTRVNDNVIPARAKISGSYVNSALARKEAIDRGFDEAILLTDDGHLAEGSAENLFLVRNGVLITPEISDNVLEGITRRTIIELAKDLNIPVEERSVDRSELYIADEAFFTGTGVQVSWIGKVDGRVIGDGKRGKITAQLQDLYFKVVRGDEEKYDKWCTKIKI